MLIPNLKYWWNFTIDVISEETYTLRFTKGNKIKLDCLSYALDDRSFHLAVSFEKMKIWYGQC